MKNIKLLALDCDGTLMTDDRTITTRTKEALIKAQENGIKIALVSGRPRTGFHYEINALELEKHHGLIGAYNGGLVLDITTGEEKYKKSISTNDAKAFLKAIEKYDLTYIVDHEGNLYTNSPDNQYVIHEYTNHKLKLIHDENLSETINFNPMKILLTQEAAYIDGIYEELVKLCGEKLGNIRSTPFYLEITAAGVNKSHALDHICNAVQIEKHEVASFGDQLNDYEMINDAGIGVAMGNAIEEIKEIADIVTADNNHDGIADVVEKILKAQNK